MSTATLRTRAVRTETLPDGSVLATFPAHREWTFNGKKHRVDGPAIESKDGDQWWRNGLLHREGGPALDYPFGLKEWHVNGKRHRADGPAILDKSGTASWYLYGASAMPEVEQRLMQVYEADSLGDDDHWVLAVVGQSPWVAAVALANPRLRLSSRAHGFLSLLASTV